MDATPGITFAEGVGSPFNHTDTNLEQYVNSATFTKALLADFVAGQRPFSKGGSFPTSPSTGDGFILTSPTDYLAVFYYNGSGWVEIASGLVLTNRSGSTVAYGQVVAVSTTDANSFQYPTSSANTLVIGVAGAAVANLDACPVITWGPVILYELSTPTNNGTALFNNVNLYGASGNDARTGGNSTCFGRLLDETLRLAFIDVMIS